MSALASRLDQISKAIGRENGKKLASLVSLPVRAGEELSQGTLQLAQACVQSPNYKRDIKSHLGDTTIATAVSEYFGALVGIVQREWKACLDAERKAYMALLDYFRENNWVIPVLKTFSEELRMLASIVDVGMRMTDNENLREVVQVLTNGFTAVAKDRTPVTNPSAKKLAIFVVTNVLFKIYFKLNTLHNATKLINVVEGPGSVLGSLTLFPVCDVVTYKYYIGRLRMFEDNFEEARECLQLALRYTPSSQHMNRQRILASLIPVEMSLGVMPTFLVSAKYGLDEYFILAQAAIQGNIRDFEDCMQLNRISLIRLGVFLVLERVKLITYRNLFKKVLTIVDTSRPSLSSFQRAINWLSSEEIDLDQVECIIANLIFQKKLNGYISHGNRMLVVSKKNPFPKENIIKPNDS